MTDWMERTRRRLGIDHWPLARERQKDLARKIGEAFGVKGCTLTPADDHSSFTSFIELLLIGRHTLRRIGLAGAVCLFLTGGR